MESSIQDATILLGHWSVFGAFVLAGWAAIAGALGGAARSFAMTKSAERAVLAATGFTLLAAACLVRGFLSDDFRLDYVYLYSSTSQALPYKIAALWGGQAGSLLLWVALLAVMASIMVLTNRRHNRALMPWAVAVVATTMAFFLLLLNVVEPPFRMGPMRPDGVGLNPQLKNYWMMIHPPTLYVGYVGFTIPFAFGIAALITRRTGDLWFRTTRRWTLCAWTFLGTGILLGSYWAYIELGWGGYWAWDPVENASLMPWLTGTAFLHSVMIQERKGMLKVWNALLVILTFCLSIFGTFLTRSGIISSVHSFATSNIGPFFVTFLFLAFFGSLVLLILRLGDLRSEARLESILSREASFLFNNMIFVGIAGTVLLLTTFPILSELFTGRKVTMGPPIFNMVNVPWALVLLLLAGVGPLVAWRKASTVNLKRNFAGPVLIGTWVLLLLLFRDVRGYLSAVGKTFAAMGQLDLALALERVQAFYPPLTFAIGAFVTATVVSEFWRGTRIRMRHHDESGAIALGRLVSRNKRRYGGYIVHLAMVTIFFGIAGSSAYRHESVHSLVPGEILEVGPYWMRYDQLRLVAEEDHIGAIVEASLFDAKDGTVLAKLAPEQRLHPNLQFEELRSAFVEARRLGQEGSPEYQRSVVGLFGLIRSLESRAQREVKTPSTEVAIHASWSLMHPARLAEDFYVIPVGIDPDTGQASFRVFINPMVNLIWFGGLLFVAGSILGVLPDARERNRLAGALALEDRAIA